MAVWNDVERDFLILSDYGVALKRVRAAIPSCVGGRAPIVPAYEDYVQSYVGDA